MLFRLIGRGIVLEFYAYLLLLLSELRRPLGIVFYRIGGSSGVVEGLFVVLLFNYEELDDRTR